ncbi:MAG: asparagine synthase-related protein, partial [Candidatus Nanoarchaeia archaeon]
MQRFFTLKDLLKFSFVCDCDIYNFDDLGEKYNLKANSNNQLLHFLLRLKGLAVLDEIDGTYSFAFFDGKDIFLARDVIGLKPLYYSVDDGLAFAFVKNELNHFKNIEELNPRKILRYDVKNRKVRFIDRPFFSIKPEVRDRENVVVDKLSSLFVESMNKRIPNCKFGIMFSGGVDSTLIAFVCKKLGFDFTCYTSHFSYPRAKEAD